jgi:hypothetical protein
MNQNSQLDELEIEIQIALNLLCEAFQAAPWPPDEWTPRLKGCLGQVALKNGYSWRSSDSGGEFLWDGAMEMRDAERNLVRLVLALESEWSGKAEIKKDFEKLLVSNAEHKLMVCSAESLAGVRKHFSRLENFVAAYRTQSDDRYLLAGWHGKEDSAGTFFFNLLVPKER